MNEQLSATSSAPDTQAPLTAQMTGFRIARIAAAGVRADGPPASSGPRSRLLKSTPALNTGSTPVSTIAVTVSSASAAANAARSSARSGPCIAFFDSARSMVRTRTPSRCSVRRNSVIRISLVALVLPTAAS